MIQLPPDIHTHDPERHDAVIQLTPGRDMADDGRVYSIGIHPWDTTVTDADWEQLLDEVSRTSSDRRIVMIGETGIDSLRGGSIPLQTMLLRRQAEISEACGKPLLLHVVRAWPRVLALRRRMRPAQPWIAHGFRGKPQLAAELLRSGIDISLGEHFNPETAAMIPAGRLYTETDTSPAGIDEIRQRINAFRSEKKFN